MSLRDLLESMKRGREGWFGLRALRRWQRKRARNSLPAPVVVPPELDEALRFYEGLFGHLRHSEIDIVVIVDGDRDVVALWHDFFPNARVRVLDRAVMQDSLPERLLARVSVDTGNHADPGFLLALAKHILPSVVIDHRGHFSPGHVACLRAFYERLAPGGVYLVMDLGLGSPEGSLDAHTLLENLARHLIGSAEMRGGDSFIEDAVLTTDQITFRGRGCALKKRVHAMSRLRPVPLQELSDQPGRSFGQPRYHRGSATLVRAPDAIVAVVAQHADEAVEPPESLVCHLHDAVVFGRGIIRVGDCIVRESLINLQPGDGSEGLWFHPDGAVHIAVSATHEERISVAEPTLLLAQRWDENYGHWIVDVLPRLSIASRVVDVSTILVALHDNPRMRHVYLDSLALFGIAPKQVIWLDTEEVTFRDLIFPTPVTVSPWVKSPLILESAERIVAAVAPATKKVCSQERLYVSRNRWGRRRLLNEPEVIARLTRRGYRVVHPEELTFREQVALFARADRIVGAMGAALANLLYAPTGVQLFALTNRDMIDDFFFDLVGLKGGRYYSLHGDSSQPGLGMNSDFSISPELLDACLDEWGF